MYNFILYGVYYISLRGLGYFSCAVLVEEVEDFLAVGTAAVGAEAIDCFEVGEGGGAGVGDGPEGVAVEDDI